jgi:hypothetical protein
MYTKKTETCILDDKIVVYHRYHPYETVQAAPYPYVIIKYPSTSNALYPSGLAHIIRHLQIEQIIQADERMKYIKRISMPFYLAVKDQIDDVNQLELLSVDGGYEIPVLFVNNLAAMKEIVPSQVSEKIFLESESLNVQRAREALGIPDIIDSSNTKSHVSGVPQRMQAAQTQLDVILERCKDSMKLLFQKMHIYTMAYMSGDVYVEGSSSLIKNKNSGTLTQEDIDLLKSQKDLIVQLTAGDNINADKIEQLVKLQNTPVAAQTLQLLGPEAALDLQSLLYYYSGVTEASEIFDKAKSKLEDQANNPPAPMPGQPPMPPGAPMPPQQMPGIG